MTYIDGVITGLVIVFFIWLANKDTEANDKSVGEDKIKRSLIDRINSG